MTLRSIATARVGRWWLVAACATLLALPAQGAVFRADDSGTAVSPPVAEMKWRRLAPGRAGGDDTIEGTVRVDLRLNLLPWLNRPARIFLALAPVTNPVTARWTTQGRLLPGHVRSGQRTLVFEGVAGPAELRESLVLVLETDGTQATQLQNLNFHFEIEVSP